QALRQGQPRRLQGAARRRLHRRVAPQRDRQGGEAGARRVREEGKALEGDRSRLTQLSLRPTLPARRGQPSSEPFCSSGSASSESSCSSRSGLDAWPSVPRIRSVVRSRGALGSVGPPGIGSPLYSSGSSTFSPSISTLPSS